jgi:hypothetical protein
MDSRLLVGQAMRSATSERHTGQSSGEEQPWSKLRRGQRYFGDYFLTQIKYYFMRKNPRLNLPHEMTF